MRENVGLGVSMHLEDGINVKVQLHLGFLGLLQEPTAFVALA